MGQPHEGPYRVIRGERPDEMSKIVKESDPEYLIAYCIRDRNHLARANDDATADLLAAAWDLLESLEMVSALDRAMTAGERRRVESAIAKAKGC